MDDNTESHGLNVIALEIEMGLVKLTRPVRLPDWPIGITVDGFDLPWYEPAWLQPMGALNPGSDDPLRRILVWVAQANVERTEAAREIVDSQADDAQFVLAEIARLGLSDPDAARMSSDSETILKIVIQRRLQELSAEASRMGVEISEAGLEPPSRERLYLTDTYCWPGDQSWKDQQVYYVVRMDLDDPTKLSPKEIDLADNDLPRLLLDDCMGHPADIARLIRKLDEATEWCRTMAREAEEIRKNGAGRR